MLEITVEQSKQNPSHCIVKINGSINVYTVNSFFTSILDCIHHHNSISVDLYQVKDIDPSGKKSLSVLKQYAEKINKPLNFEPSAQA